MLFRRSAQVGARNALSSVGTMTLVSDQSDQLPAASPARTPTYQEPGDSENVRAPGLAATAVDHAPSAPRRVRHWRRVTATSSAASG